MQDGAAESKLQAAFKGRDALGELLELICPAPIGWVIPDRLLQGRILLWVARAANQ